MNQQELLSRQGLVIVYDKECPFCSNFVAFYKLRSQIERVDLIDAREYPELSAEMSHKGQSLNDGMVVFWAGQDYYAADAMQILALISASGGVFNTVNKALFARPKLAALIYPVLVFCRKLILKFMGRQPLQ